MNPEPVNEAVRAPSKPYDDNSGINGGPYVYQQLCRRFTALISPRRRDAPPTSPPRRLKLGERLVFGKGSIYFRDAAGSTSHTHPPPHPHRAKYRQLH